MAASAMTAAAGTAHTSERSIWALPGALVSRSAEASGRMSVERGLRYAVMRTSSPLVMPPSMPPARFVGWWKPRSPSWRMGSCAAEPGPALTAIPSPTSTPFTDWIDMKWSASRASSFRSHCTWEPRPGGTPRAMTSTFPPNVSPRLLRRIHRRHGPGADGGIGDGHLLVEAEAALVGHRPRDDRIAQARHA